MQKAPLAPDVVDVFVEHLNQPKPFVRQVIGTLKAADRIDSGRPISPPMTPRSIARILLALASPNIKDSARHGQALGALPLSEGDSQPNLETALTDIVEEAAGWRNGDTNFRDDRVVLADSFASVGSATFRAGKPSRGLHRFIAIDTAAIARIARALLPFERA
jgi:hypothetical protein